MEDERISYKILANVGVLAQYSTGWSKEANIISWNNSAPKFDVRDLSPDHGHMSRGITLNAEEAQRLVEVVQARDAIGMLKDMGKPTCDDFES